MQMGLFFLESVISEPDWTRCGAACCSWSHQTISRGPLWPQLFCDLQLQVTAFISIQRPQFHLAYVFFQISPSV